MMDDTRITEALVGRERVPYPGSWLTAPFVERAVGGRTYAVVADDPGLSALAVDRATGQVWLLADGDEVELVNSSLRALVACSRAYAEAALDAAHLDDEDEDAGDELTDALLARLAALDEVATDDENAFWSVAAEELGYGITV
ncbi:SUKH-4 family immunity protein [Streptomyces millisiae]|uniref:SUKH-4 family immunity protein n=1 Tax=Streptomyces millisiae TaxID=3075542 RepID=A0ABU2LV21_9ACTN|nr:SUKH-4 family immunity protein [Streptomyces sp. DSM 44918]MDT0321108.1 SUKH-4 family immunity protein [Streptomyces sp. DSM 44918]